jgi:hypothetical protein
MQARYLGDSHDFLKYALLRHLHAATRLRLGVNWYLTLSHEVDRPGNNDGEKRHHLKGGDWQQSDLDLFDRIGRFDLPANRVLENVANWGLLPEDTVYFSELVSSSERQAWHGRAVASMADAGLVFLDPDNGFEVKSMSPRTQPKYSGYSEVGDYLKYDQAVLAIQFARQCDPVARAQEVRDRLVGLYGNAAKLPVIRGRVAPNILFFSLAPERSLAAIAAALRTFGSACAKVNLIP